MDHGFGNVDPGFVVADEASPSHHPSEGLLDDPSSRQNFEALLAVDAAHHFDDEVEIGGLVHELAAIINAVSEQVLDPRPSFANGLQHRLCAGTIGDTDRREVYQQQPAIGVDGDMALAADDLLAVVEAALRAGEPAP